MIKIENFLIPFTGYRCMAIWPFIFVRDDLMVPINDVDINHEEIHGQQQLEVFSIAILLSASLLALGCGWWSLVALPLFFYWYMTEWIVRLFINGKTAYRNISFEQEAYIYERDMCYRKTRKHFAWLRYMFKATY